MIHQPYKDRLLVEVGNLVCYKNEVWRIIGISIQNGKEVMGVKMGENIMFSLKYCVFQPTLANASYASIGNGAHQMSIADYEFLGDTDHSARLMYF